jgi:phosphatidylglycerophosphate synthase
MTSTNSDGTMPAARGLPVLPLIRYLSRPVTPLLARLPVTANQITALSLVLGLGAAWAMLQGTWTAMVTGGILLVAGYVLDNCDGEIARLKNQCSTFGMYFDSFVDWIVHTVFFVALGIGVATAKGEPLWLWLGLIAAAGGTINYALGFLLAARQRAQTGMRVEDAARQAIENPESPRNWREWMLFAFRELSRADFCFIVLALAVFDVAWILLPAGAVGAQVYWATQLMRRARAFHV